MPLDIREKLNTVPHKPGVYIFKDKDAVVLYVGKARDLRSRLGQYFGKDGDGRIQIPFLMREAENFEYIITDTDVESLLLENTLIKQHKPRYNIKLRDDKNYVFIKIDYDTQIPQIYTVRNPDSKNARYFGPYSSAFKVRETLAVVRKVFPYCANKEIGQRPCFYYFLHRCPGVCVGKITLEDYQQTIDKIALFLAGNIRGVKKEIEEQMKNAAEQKMFERAAELRDQCKALEVIEERQKTIFAEPVDWDFISHFQSADKTTVNLFVIRSGRMIDRKNFILENTDNRPVADIMHAFIEKYYLDNEELPREIYVQDQPNDQELLEEFLKNKAGRNLKIQQPERGKKAELIELGIENAKEFFESWALDQLSEISRTTLALEELKTVLKMDITPSRIECFDISNIQGTNSVASMVVFEKGKPKKSDYRKFKIKIDGEPNDFAMMKEALTRRFSPAHRDPENPSYWPNPDLLVIDGGKGQLGVAVEVLAQYGSTMRVIGLAKREEEIFTPESPDPIVLPHSDYALQLLQRLRDEAHRFGITFHRQLRSKGAYRSALDSIPGIGPKKKKALIKKFGSVQGIKSASQEEIAEIIGPKLAENIRQQL
jgi:excinuclease ABC subunit C